ncbi:MAG TPA: ABC transporter permease [Alphaproteobacteria bacterium]|nr:ABC transporter permease [Alphaproteobacteria bacterium]
MTRAIGSGLSVNAFAVFVLAFLLFPVLVVVGISFSSAEFLAFPPPGLSLRWYRAVFSNWQWVDAFWLTLQVGGLTMLLSTLLGVPAAFALSRHVKRGQGLLNMLILAALITPAVIKAISIYLYYVPLALLNTVWGLAFAHTVSGIPFVVINVVASLKSYDGNLERAAVIHGAPPIRAVLGITIPIVAPGIIVGAVFAFMQSAQELLVSIFVLGTVRKPLSVKLWEGVQVAIDPTIAAATTSVTGLALLGLLTVMLASRRNRTAARAA